MGYKDEIVRSMEWLAQKNDTNLITYINIIQTVFGIGKGRRPAKFNCFFDSVNVGIKPVRGSE